MRNRKGYVLMHVLIILIVMIAVAAGLAKMLLARQIVLAKAASGAAGRKVAEGGLGQLLAKWADPSAAGPCATTTIPTGYTCSGCVATPPVNVSCTLTSTCTCGPAGPASCPTPKTITATGSASGSFRVSFVTCP